MPCCNLLFVLSYDSISCGRIFYAHGEDIFGTEIHMLKSITDELAEYLKNYKIVRKLGEGGMGVVYQVFDAELNRTLAVKIISPRANSKISKRFFTRSRNYGST